MGNNYYFNQKVIKTDNEVINKVVKIDRDFPPLVRTNQTGDKVFLFKDGIFYWITTVQVLKAIGGSFADVKTIDYRISSVGEKITMENVKDFVLDQEKEIKQEFKQYEEEGGMPHETIFGFTSIIMPVYFNSYPAFHYTGNAIGSIREHTNKNNTPYEIIMIINGNTGIKLANLSETKADKVIENPENVGYGKAVNQGIRCAKGEYIAILNNDIMVFDHWLEDMQKALTDLDLVMATPMYGEPFARALEAQQKRNSTITEGLPEETLKQTFSDFKDFSCILTRKELFNKIGLFDEQFFMYGEDLDLMRRMDQAELKYASTKRVNIHHIISGTSSGMNETPEIMNESKRKLKEKWGY